MSNCTEVNSVELSPVGNSVDICLFSVTSEYYLLTQFQSYKHDMRVGDTNVDSH